MDSLRIIERIAEGYYPFFGGGSRLAAALAEVLRLFDLRAGESLRLRGHPGDYLYVVDGRVQTQQGDRLTVVHPEQTVSQPLIFSAADASIAVRALDDCYVAHADRDRLDHLLSWEVMLGCEDDLEQDVRERMARVRNALAFQRLPLECVEEAFRRMASVQVLEGEEVVREGEPGNAFYVIASGQAEVLRRAPDGDTPVCLATLTEGDAFGEEALVSGEVRNATVRMATPGRLLVLAKEDFEELVQSPLLRRVEPSVASAMLAAGYAALDVRNEDEYRRGHIRDARLLPLRSLRERCGELDPSRCYVVYCEGGQRSAAAAFLLRQRKLEAVSVAGGLRAWRPPLVSDEPN
jgi:CRP-like cAMP-binding protein